MANKGLIIGSMALAFGALIFSGYAEKNMKGTPEAVMQPDKAQTPLQVLVEDVLEGQPLPQKYAYCIATAEEKSSPTGQNISPAVRWSKGPEGTKSYAVIMVDTDVPTDFKDAGVAGKTLPIDMKRQDFIHWALIGIKPDVFALNAGVGKTPAAGQIAAVNDYAAFMKDKPASDFVGYNGMCPPWNDELIHRYYFYVYALDKEFTPADFPNAVNGLIPAKDVPMAIAGHILSKGSVMGTYTLNPEVKK